jgi:hypothetical protein
MRKVFKYALEIADEQILDLPTGSQILHVTEQHGQLRLWALIDLDAKVLVPRTLLMRGTGHDIVTDGDLRHISTIFMNDGMLVFHFFEEVTRGDSQST